MTKNIPGTILELNDENTATFRHLDEIFSVAGGIGLSQIASISGLRGSTIQNWVKRGWVPSPDGRKYSDTALSRVLIINVLRDCMSLDKIAGLMTFVNGRVNDRSDDIVTDRELYNMLSGAIIALEKEQGFAADNVAAYVRQQLGDYTGPLPDSRERLEKALTIMLLSYYSSTIKRQVEQLLDTI